MTAHQTPPPRSPLKLISTAVLSVGMLWIGLAHFYNSEFFDRIIPNWLPAHHTLTLVSGFFEIAGGVGIMIPALRRAAAIGLVLLYIAVFPANINMALHPPAKYSHEVALLWLRLPLQFVLIAWALWLSKDQAAPKVPHPAPPPTV